MTAVAVDAYSFYEAESKWPELARIAGGWTGAWAGGAAGAWFLGGSAAAVGSAGPQVFVPEEVLTVPDGAIIGGMAGGAIGYWGGSNISLSLYNKFIQQDLNAE